MKTMIMAMMAVSCAVAFCDSREDRPADLANICAFIPSDNLDALRPPNLTGKPAELYDAAQADAAQED